MLRRKANNRRENRENNTRRVAEKIQYCMYSQQFSAYNLSGLCGKNVFA
ncbi:MAG: hypothetical protein HY841_01465 [Bacteroidetes bacterium]|nr:hypothetical protein [Bacteroidota bacterium]